MARERAPRGMRPIERTISRLCAGCVLALVATGCASSPEGEYCACPEHGKPKRCVEVKENGDNVDLELKVDGSTQGSMSAKYVEENGYGHAETDLGQLEVSLGWGVLGVGPKATSAQFKGDRAGVFNFSVMTREHSCK